MTARTGAREQAVTFPCAEGTQLELTALDSARADWQTLMTESSATRLYHREPWLETLKRAYGFKFFLATIHDRSRVLAGCVMARSKNPFALRFISLPFSDFCPPLATDAASESLLLAALATEESVRFCEIRGVAAASPWQTVDCFLAWELDISRPAAKIERSMATNFRRNINRARSRSVKIEYGTGLGHCRIGPSYLERFYALHFESRRRRGLPCQPLRFFRTVCDAFRGGSSSDAEFWIASIGGRDLAAAVVLSDQDRAYWKWSARADGDTLGASHLLAWSIVVECSGNVPCLDLGRTDSRNEGLNRFKREFGAVSRRLPYSFVPHPPRAVSAEIHSGSRAAATQVWRHMPRMACRAIGGLLYGYLA
jgi:hypothetical protein